MKASWPLRYLLRSLAYHLGYSVVHRSEEAVLQELLLAYNDLRLNLDNTLAWDHRLSHIASLGHMRSLFRLHQIDLLIDVGANRGQFALDARRAGYRGEIISFEPLARHQAQLAELAVRDGHWTIVPCGLGTATEELELNVFKDDTFSSVLKINPSATANFGVLVDLDHIERILVRPLDVVCQELSIPLGKAIFLKTDTQGHDAAVLAGATRTLDQTVVVLSEATVAPLYDNASTLDDINSILLQKGFQRSGLFPIGYGPESHALLELDCYFARVKRLPRPSERI